MINEQKEFDDNVKSKIGKAYGGIPITEEHTELETTVSQHQSQNLQHENQDRSTVRNKNLWNYNNRNQESTISNRPR
ncbi:unnamed protein product [Schistosoma mattheei]|uniref:Uncharacterized protein n=1 Tax=Schistosoma mattheei TaxID=31246 RepID=A0A183Q0X1_9TREM|nr:unnamed protein product [Schistosoma mattheei]